jgi:hypothetical protein
MKINSCDHETIKCTGVSHPHIILLVLNSDRHSYPIQFSKRRHETLSSALELLIINITNNFNVISTRF